MVEAIAFKQNIRPNWCPGCGNYAVLKAIPQALSNLEVEPRQVAMVTGIGCSGRLAGYLNTYGFHGIHGRALPVAQGIKLANRNLTVLAAGGDGDGLGIGLNHLVHAIRRNLNITYIIMDNHIYGLTKGQTSPTSPSGLRTKTTPRGNIDAALSPLTIALGAGITFLARGWSGDTHQLEHLIEAGIRHNGFSLVIVFTPCLTYNKENTLEWFKKSLANLELDPDYDPTNRAWAFSKAIEYQDLLTGLIYQQAGKSYQDHLDGYAEAPLNQQDLTLPAGFLERLLAEFR